MSIFAKNKHAICYTNLIIKVKSYQNGSPLFYLEKVINDGVKANSMVEKLNELAEIEKENEENQGWKTEYFTTSFTY
tara:strand:- start:1554 stop:1784 length:231 start_codon:yes stop_codon:yes gene_type:complete